MDRRAFGATAVVLAALALGSVDAGATVLCGRIHVQTITGNIRARGTSCFHARVVFRVVERTPLPEDVSETPYFQFSEPYVENTPYGQFSCRWEPSGLAGSEHTIICHHGYARVSWDTVHD